MGIDQGSDSSAGDDVDDDESSSDGGPSSGDEGFLAPGDGVDDATPMKDDEQSPPATIRTGRMRTRTVISGDPAQPGMGCVITIYNFVLRAMRVSLE
jgi:hypothetical protein